MSLNFTACKRTTETGRTLHGLRRAVLPERQPARRHDIRMSASQSGAGDNDLIYQELETGMSVSKDTLFPEFTGRVCPALCEAACTCALNGDPVAIKDNEKMIIEHAFQNGWVTAQPPKVRTGKTVAGSEADRQVLLRHYCSTEEGIR